MLADCPLLAGKVRYQLGRFTMKTTFSAFSTTAVLIAGLWALVQSPSALAADHCDGLTSLTPDHLMECVSNDGVRAHQAALQAIADANDGHRLAGTAGFDDSVAYVVAELTAAGYAPTVQSFGYVDYYPLGPSTLRRTAPSVVNYVEFVDYQLMTHSDPGNVTGLVTAVDLSPGLGNGSTSGCEASDFAGFPAGDIALVQRGACSFQLKAENAAAAGAVGAIIFNQGNTESRKGLIGATLSSGYSGGIPVFFATYDRGIEWAGTAGMALQMIADVFRGAVTAHNVFAETAGGDASNVIMAGAHLDSVLEGPGIQDNGSGSSAILEVALQIASLNPRNKVRFAWWGAEESGLIGSTHYVNNLTAAELSDIGMYLDFEMIGSPNGVRFVLDGDGSEGGFAGAPGSEVIEDFFKSHYAGRGLASSESPLLSFSDSAFTFAGIPSGGLFAGAAGIKTPEEAAIYGGTAGDQYDPCYHLACDTFDNISLSLLDENSDAAAAAILQFATDTVFVLTARAKRGKVSLLWNPVPGATGYNVYRSTDPAAAFAMIAGNHMTDYATYLDSTAEAGLTYYYYVTALNGGAETAPSNVVEVEVPAARGR